MDTSNKLLPDYVIDHKSGGGARVYATAIKTAYFEEHTRLYAKDLFPNSIVHSAGLLVHLATHLPHPKNPNAPLMSAQQLVERFVDIAQTLPKRPNLILNGNNGKKLQEAIYSIIGNARLKDINGTMFTTYHKIGGGEQSYVPIARLVNPETGEVTYIGDPEKYLIDTAMSATALHTLFPPHEEGTDLAIADNTAVPLLTLRQLFENKTGLFVRMGNFRASYDPKNYQRLHTSGHIRSSLTGTAARAISNNVYSQSLQIARSLFNPQLVFNLEQELDFSRQHNPKVEANVATPIQFKRIRALTEEFIEANRNTFEYLGDLLGEMAIRRMNVNPDAAFGNCNLGVVRPEPFTFPPAANDDLLSPSGSKEGKAVLSKVFMKEGRSRVIGALMGAWQALGLASFGHQLPANANQPTPTDQIQRSTTRQPSQEIANDLK